MMADKHQQLIVTPTQADLTIIFHTRSIDRMFQQWMDAPLPADYHTGGDYEDGFNVP